MLRAETIGTIRRTRFRKDRPVRGICRYIQVDAVDRIEHAARLARMQAARPSMRLRQGEVSTGD